jgi:hypothetical protein
MLLFRRLSRLLVVLVPFGLLSRHKPRHSREMLRVLWENLGRWLYALRILRHGFTAYAGRFRLDGVDGA